MGSACAKTLSWDWAWGDGWVGGGVGSGVCGKDATRGSWSRVWTVYEGDRCGLKDSDKGSHIIWFIFWKNPSGCWVEHRLQEGCSMKKGMISSSSLKWIRFDLTEDWNSTSLPLFLWDSGLPEIWAFWIINQKNDELPPIRNGSLQSTQAHKLWRAEIICQSSNKFQ